MNDGVLLSIIGLCIILSAYFSATETAFSSLNRIRLRNLAQNGNKRAQLADKLADNFDQLLSTILIGNNIVNILCASLGTVFFVKHFGDAGATISTAVITIVLLICSEVTPKSLAKENPESFACFSAPIINITCKVFTPLNFLFMKWRKFISHFSKNNADSGITEDEFIVMVDEAKQDGGINEQESQMIRNVLEFNDTDAVDIITPRVDIVAISLDAENKEIADTFSESGFSRLPVYEGTTDNIIGFLHQKDFYHFAKQTIPLKQMIKPVIVVPEGVKVHDLLRMLQRNKCHMAIVSDEYGGTLGIVTMEDLLEELVGEIWDEHDDIVENIEKIDDTHFNILGGAPTDVVFDYFSKSVETDATTIGGWAMECLGCIPQKGDTFTKEGLIFTVQDVDHRRITKLLVEKLPSDEETSSVNL